MTFDKEELMRLGIQAKMAQLTAELDELRAMLRRRRPHATQKTDAAPKAKKKMTPRQHAALKKAWAALAAKKKARDKEQGT